MSRVSFARVSASPPPARELLDVEADGSWTAWRSTGTAVGRFAGPPDVDGPGARILALADATASVDPPALGDQPLDATIDQVQVDGRSLQTGYRAEPSGPWGELVMACRELLDEAVVHPVAAITLTILARDRLRLEHRGTEPLLANLAGARAEGTVWTDAGEYLTRGKGRLDSGPVEARPGWSADLVLEGLDPEKPGNLVATMALTVEDDGEAIPARLSAGRAPG